MPRWFKVCSVSELRPGQALSISLRARRLAVFNVEGVLYGLDGACAHMKANLAAARLDGHMVECRMHHWRYDLTTGQCLTELAVRLRTYPVKVDAGQIWIGVEWPLEGDDPGESA